ncbi:amidohydrolase family protein [Candidatus Latescibacterota bacterium]
MSKSELYHRLKNEIDRLPVVDIHEHLAYPEEDYLEISEEYGVDFGRFMFWYTVDDLLSSGMIIPDLMEFRSTLGAVLRVNGKVLSLDEKWNYIKPYWENIRYTGYSRAVLHSINKLLDIDDLNDSTYREVSEKLKALMKPGVYGEMLSKQCGFTHIVNDIDTTAQPGAGERMDRDLLHFVSRFRQFSYVYKPGGIETLEEKYGRTIRNIDHLLDAMDRQFDLWIKDDRRIALKMADAYLRDLSFEDNTRDEAERVMRRIFTLRKIPNNDETLSYAEARPLENFVMHRILDRAEEHGIPLIVHTGIQTYMGNEVGNSNATLLTNLFIKYPRLKFHLLHANYPWMHEATCLAKQFHNVSLDLTWVHIIVPEGAREGLSHQLDTVPVNKIHAFGGDALVPETVWGALEAARENTAHVLADKVETGHMKEEQAVNIAQKMFSENARNIFSLE